MGSAHPALQEGDLVAGRYRLLRPIGAGGMGTVWAARHELLGRDFALKLASISEKSGPDARARFLREAQIVGRLRHPNVVDVADVGEAAPGAGLYLAMELLEGQSLGARIREGGKIPAGEALAIAGEICRGLSAAHEAGVIHRDLKPENIFLARGPGGGVVPKLLDFGISKSGEAGETLSTMTGQLFGTPAYMSPEQALGETDVDHRTDLWSLGVVLYEMLAGHRPFDAESYPALLPLIIDAEHAPLPPEVPPEARRVVAGCLAKDRHDRYPTADALRRSIDNARAALGETLTPSLMPIERPRALPLEMRSAEAMARGGTGRRTLLAAAGAAALLVVATTWRWRLPERPASAAAAPPRPVETAPVLERPPPPLIDDPPAPSAAAPSASAPAPLPPASARVPRGRGAGKSVTGINNAGF